MKKDVVITLPRDVAIWLLIQFDKNMAELCSLISDDDFTHLHDLAVFDLKYFNYLYCVLKYRVSKREINAFLDSRPCLVFEGE